MWRIYYEDGITRGWEHGVDDIQTHGVLCILQKSPHYQIVHGCQYFMLVKGEWLHAKSNDVVEYVRLGRKIDKLLIGRMTTNRIFNEVHQAAKNDKNAENL